MVSAVTAQAEVRDVLQVPPNSTALLAAAHCSQQCMGGESL